MSFTSVIASPIELPDGRHDPEDFDWRDLRDEAADVLEAAGWPGRAEALREIGRAEDFGHAVDSDFCLQLVRRAICEARHLGIDMGALR